MRCPICNRACKCQCKALDELASFQATPQHVENEIRIIQAKRKAWKFGSTEPVQVYSCVDCSGVAVDNGRCDFCAANFRAKRMTCI